MKFERLHDWAVLPTQRQVNLDAARDRQQLYREHFRHLRAERQPEFCAPWVLGQKVGWRVHSPVDVHLSPLPQYEVSADEPRVSAAAVGMQELWLRSGSGLVMDRPPWLHHFQFREGEAWGNMFVPNGHGTVEWRLGWVPKDVGAHSIMIFPSEDMPDLGVLVGVLAPAVVARMDAKGFSVACSPRRPLSIRRGQEIARFVLVGPESLRSS
jgi:hypothetical protein